MPPTTIKGQMRWERLRQLLEKGGGPSPASMEAAQKLVDNHVYVLKDVTHPTPCTQTELARVDISCAHIVDEALRFLAWRLMGSPSLDETLEPANDEQAATWRCAARFLDGRLQDAAEQHPGRKPDLSVGAARAMRAVLRDMSGDEVSHPAPPCERASAAHHLLSPYFTAAHFAA